MGCCRRGVGRGALAMVRSALLVAIGLGAAGAGESALSDEVAMTRQKSSHEAAFFRDLLTDRVWVYQMMSADSPSIRDYGSAAYFHADGRVTICTSTREGAIDNSGRWRVVPSARFVTLFNYLAPGEEPDPVQVRSHVPIFYDGETGQLHSEKWIGEDSWQVFLRGWVQESWPAGLAAVCPELGPQGVAVNGAQESLVFWKLAREDPAAAVRRFPGFEKGIPGAKGLAASGHQPTYPAEDLQAWLAENNGKIVRSGLMRYALALGPRGDEVWLLKDDDDEIVDTIELIPSEDGYGVVLQFRSAPIRLLYRLGYPLGMASTGERYGAFALTDWLVERGEAVALPFGDRENVGFRFLGNGGLRVGTRAGREIGGEWWWSKGMLHVRVDGIEAVNTFEWRALAHHVGWSG